MQLTFRQRLKPTKEQEKQLFDILRHLRDIHNWGRSTRKDAWREFGISLSYYTQGKMLTQTRAILSEWKSYPQDMQNHALRRVDKAFQNFFRRVKQGEKSEKRASVCSNKQKVTVCTALRAAETPKQKHPRFSAKVGYPRHRTRYRSMTFSLRKNKEGERQQPIVKTGYRHDLIKIPKVGQVKVRMSRPLIGDPKQVTIVKKASGWYAHITCELPDVPKVKPNTATGVDVGTAKFLTTAHGDTVDNPRFYRKSEKLLSKKQRIMSRRKKGSHRRWKARYAVALLHERIANRRRDFIGKVVNFLYRKYDIVVAEELQITNMVKNRKLSKSIADASWGEFFRWCGSIAERDGYHFHQMSPHNTSQTCSHCHTNAKKKLRLSDRTFTCSVCGWTLDRDQNAAMNMLHKAADAFRGEAALATSVKRELAGLMGLNNPMPSGLGI